MARAFWILFVFGCIASVAGGAALFTVYRASQQVPDFYHEALAIEPEVQKQAGDSLEQQVLELHNEVRQPGRWEAKFTNGQINGWLAYELPRKFSAVLPPGVADPRVAIRTEEVRIACRYEANKVSSVVSLALEVHLTDEPNVVAIRVKSAKAGALPLPLKQFLDQITQRASEADLTLRWLQEEGDPVALLTIPSQHEQYRYKSLFLDSVELREGELHVAGRTESALEQTVFVARPMLVQ